MHKWMATAGAGAGQCGSSALQEKLVKFSSKYGPLLTKDCVFVCVWHSMLQAQADGLTIHWATTIHPLLLLDSVDHQSCKRNWSNLYSKWPPLNLKILSLFWKSMATRTSGWADNPLGHYPLLLLSSVGHQSCKRNGAAAYTL